MRRERYRRRISLLMAGMLLLGCIPVQGGEMLTAGPAGERIDGEVRADPEGTWRNISDAASCPDAEDLQSLWTEEAGFGSGSEAMGPASEQDLREGDGMNTGDSRPGESEVREPEVMDSGVTDPEVIMPEVIEPAVLEPEILEPEGIRQEGIPSPEDIFKSGQDGSVNTDLPGEEGNLAPEEDGSGTGAVSEEGETSDGPDFRAEDREEEETGGQEENGIEESTVPEVEEQARPVTADPESLLPVERVEEADLRALLGSGITEEVDARVDAVAEILSADPADPGLLQLAAERAGKTEEAAREAAEQMNDETVAVPEEIAEALGNTDLIDEETMRENADLLEELRSFSPLDLFSGDVYASETVEDHQSGRALSYRPADSRETAMAFLSAFVLSDVRDGAGDFDDPASYEEEGEGYDWKGNDSGDHNGVVRTNDHVTYTFSYATALGEDYIYNTISGTRLYVQYDLPMTAEEAEFDLEAMTWLLGDGEGRRPVVLAAPMTRTSASGGEETVIGQRLVGYRDLPDSGNGDESYDVPGAGTINCILRIRDALLRQRVEPRFTAWLETTSGNDGAPPEETGLPLTASNPKSFPEVRVTLGAYVAISYKDIQSGGRTYALRDAHPHFNGDFRRITDREGRIKHVGFEILIGKPNGSLKGAGPLDAESPLTVDFTLDAEASPSSFGTSCGLFDLRTADMRTDGKNAYLWNGTAEEMYARISGSLSPTGSNPFSGCGSLIRDSVTAAGGVYSFRIRPNGNIHPGDRFAGGDILLFQEELLTDAAHPAYNLRIETRNLHAVSGRDPSRTVQTFSQRYPAEGSYVYPFLEISNELDGSGHWHAHLMIGETGKNNYIANSYYTTATKLAYGTTFTLRSSQMSSAVSLNQSEQSRKLFLLWDNRKVELDMTEEGLFRYAAFTGALTGGAPDAAGLVNGGAGSRVRVVFITKKDGSFWKSEEEMRTADLLSFKDLCFYSTCRQAKERGEICGLLIENFNYKLPYPSSAIVQMNLSIGMKMREAAGPKELIGSSVMFTQSILSFRGNVTASMGGSNGRGALPDLTSSVTVDGAELAPVRMRYYVDSPRTYTKTVWDENGQLDVSSMGEHNYPHEGQTIYIDGYSLKVGSRILSGGIGSTEGETLTKDLAEGESVTYRVSPAFASKNGVSGVSGTLVLPHPLDQEDQEVMTLAGVQAIRKDGGIETLDTSGKVYSLQDFSEGATGSFTLTEGSLDKYMSGSTYTGDAYSQKVFLIRNKLDGTYLAVSGSSPVLVAKDGSEAAGDPACQWKIIYMGSGYYLVNVSTGHYLATASSVPEHGEALTLLGQSTARDGFKAGFTFRSGGLYIRHIDAYPNEHEGRFLNLENKDGELKLIRNHTNAAAQWEEIPVTEAAEGIVIRCEDLTDAAPLPDFYLTYKLDKSLVNEATRITQRAYIGETDPRTANSEDSAHSASTALSFVKTTAAAIRMRVDKELVKVSELRKGTPITYTVLYQNLYGEGHAMRLLASLPAQGDADGSVLPEGSRAEVTEITVTGSEGSALLHTAAGEASRTGHIEVSGSLKSGETVTVQYKVRVEKPEKDVCLRASCTAREGDAGEIRSNRVETGVIPSLEMVPDLYKEVNRISNAVGEKQTWTVTATIPEDFYADSGHLLVLTDDLDPKEKRLDYAGGAELSLRKISAGDGTGAPLTETEGDELPLAAGTDYLLTEPALLSAGGRVSVKMLLPGMEKMEAAGAGCALQLKLDTMINGQAKAGEQIPNHVVLRYGPSEEPFPEIGNRNPDPYVYTGEIRIRKRAGGSKRPLQGVAFALYTDAAGRTPVLKEGEPFLAVTGEDGRVSFFGLADGTYYVKETRTIRGMELLQGLFRAEVKEGLAAGGSEILVTDQVQVPLAAGGAGTDLYCLLAAFLLLLAVLSGRKRHGVKP